MSEWADVPTDCRSIGDKQSQQVGWVERSDTHHLSRMKLMGFAALYPSYRAIDARGDGMLNERLTLPLKSELGLNGIFHLCALA